MKKQNHFSLLFAFFSFTLLAQSNWQQCSTPPNASIFSMAVIGNTIFTGSNNGGIYYSTNQGLSWTQSNGGLPNHVISLASDGSRLFAGTSGFSATSIFMSSDLAQTWTNITPLGMVNSSDVNSLAVDGTHIYAGTSGGLYGVYRSPLNNISSSSWVPFSNGLPNEYVRSLAVCGSTLFASTYIIGGTNNGIHQSPVISDNWVYSSTGLSNSATQIKPFAINGNVIFAGNYSGNSSFIYKSTNGGSSWAVSSTSVFSANNGVYALLSSGNSIYAGTVLGGVYVSNNSGLSWSTFTSGLNSAGACGMNIHALVRMGATLFAGTDCGVWKVNICNTLPANAINTTPANALTICSSSSTTLSASGTGTINWYTAATGGFPIANGPTLITPILLSNTTFYAEDFTCGPSPSRIPIMVNVNPLPNIVATSNNSISCEGAVVGLWASGATSYTWQPGNINGATIFVNPITNTTYTVSGSDQNGCVNSASLFHAVSACLALSEGRMGIGSELSIYPNPNQGEFSIQNPQHENGTIVIYDLEGKEIEHCPLGLSKEIRIQNLEAGIYFIELKTKTNTYWKKVLVYK